MDMMWINQHPDYIKEKWNKYIGFKPNELELYPQDDETVSWLKKWSVSNEDWEELKEVNNGHLPI